VTIMETLLECPGRPGAAGRPEDAPRH